jgi:hypothetical protein
LKSATEAAFDGTKVKRELRKSRVSLKKNSTKTASPSF